MEGWFIFLTASNNRGLGGEEIIEFVLNPAKNLNDLYDAVIDLDAEIDITANETDRVANVVCNFASVADELEGRIDVGGGVGSHGIFLSDMEHSKFSSLCKSI